MGSESKQVSSDSIDQTPDPSTNVTKASDILLMPGYDDMGKQIIPINKSEPQEIFLLG